MKKLLSFVAIFGLISSLAFAGRDEKFSGATVFVAPGSVGIQNIAVSVTAAGTTQATAPILGGGATALTYVDAATYLTRNYPTATVYPTTGAVANPGVVINPKDNVRGRVIYVGNNTAAGTLKIYPPTGGNINAAGANAAYVSAAGRGVTLVCITAGASGVWLAF